MKMGDQQAHPRHQLAARRADMNQSFLRRLAAEQLKQRFARNAAHATRKAAPVGPRCEKCAQATENAFAIIVGTDVQFLCTACAKLTQAGQAARLADASGGAS